MTEGATTRRRPSAARQRLLRVASALFYADGIRAVGVDRVVAQASVTRATFYRHFPSKDALIVAYVQGADRAVRTRVGELGPDPADAANWLAALTAAIGDQLCGADFRGCAFINAATEYPDPTSPVRQAVREHRRWLEASVAEALRRLGHTEDENAARLWMVLRDGAMVSGYLADDAEATRATLQAATRELITPTAAQR